MDWSDYEVDGQLSITKGEVLKKYGISMLRQDLNEVADEDFIKAAGIIASEFQKETSNRESEMYKWSKNFSDRVIFYLTGRMTQRELAEKIGVTEVTLSRYITGKRIPKAPLIVKIAKTLGVPVEYLIDFEN